MTGSPPVRIAARASELALRQARMVASLLEMRGEQCEVVEIKTMGDRKREIPMEEIAAPGVSVVDHLAEEGFVTPVETAGEDSVFVSRIREDISVENGLNMWVVADNLRKGAALNAVQIAEVLVRDYLKK